MNADGDRRQQTFPDNWDVLDAADPDEHSVETGPEPVAVISGSPPKLNLVAASWADSVVLLAVVAAALVGLNVSGFELTLAVLPWALLLGAAWWLFTAAVLTTVRQGTPGMLLAGVHLGGRVAPRRVAAVVAAAAVSAVLVGLPGLLGPRRSPIAVAGGLPIETLPAD